LNSKKSRNPFCSISIVNSKLTWKALNSSKKYETPSAGIIAKISSTYLLYYHWFEIQIGNNLILDIFHDHTGRIGQTGDPYGKPEICL
jgi:hypothetical protein